VNASIRGGVGSSAADLVVGQIERFVDDRLARRVSVTGGRE